MCSPKRFALLLAFVLAAVFFSVLFNGQTFYYRDFGVLAIPTATYHRDSIWHGEIPLWNPYSNCGAPFLAQWGTMVCYPLSLLYVLLPMPWSLNFFCIAHLWLGGMGMFFLVRRWISGGWPAGLGGIAFVFNGITQASLTWPNYTAALGLFPWVVLCVERAWEPKTAPVFTNRLRNNRAAAVVIAAALSAMQILTGVPELCFLTWALLASLWVWRLTKSEERASALIWRQSAVVLITAGLVAVQILPFIELLQHSQRTPGFAGEKWALPPWGWANLLLPRFHTFKTYEGTVFQFGQEFLSSTYVGAPILILSLLGFARRDPRARIAGGLALLGAILALGSAGRLYALLNYAFPFLAIARYPVKFLFILPLTLPLLAANGILVLEQLDPRNRRRVILGSALVFTLIMGGLFWFNYAYPLPYDWWPDIKTNSIIRWIILIAFAVVLPFAFTESGASELRGALDILNVSSEGTPQRPGMGALPWRTAAIVVLFLLITFDAQTHLPRQNPTTNVSLFAPDFWEQAQRKSNLNFQKPDAGRGRAFITPGAEEHLLRSVVGDAEKDLIGKRLALWSHLNLLDRVPKVNGSSTLQVREQAVVQKALYSGTNENLSAWLDFLNVTLETASNSVVEWQPRPTAMPFLTGGQAVELAGKPTNLPSNFNFGTRVLLASPSPALQLSERGTEVQFSEINITPHEITFAADAEAPTVVVIPQAWYPAWRVEYRGTAAPPPAQQVLRANIAFQAVPIPKGHSVLRVFYRDRFFLLGASISVSVLLLSMGALALGLRTEVPAPQ
ncbi:MAG TPA: YfhO family protein [Verrucomicrobiae bacterium]|nr:YfhO family protein [Verrucomicrobiae bacterium]